MGMASSQWRLLALTSELHDIEFKAQSLEEAKIQLATQQDEVFQRYCDALDAKKITVGYKGDPYINYVDANFTTMCGYKPNRKNDYALINNVNHTVYVDQKTKDLYDEYGNDKYVFAWACLYGNDVEFGYGEGFNTAAGCVGINQGYNSSDIAGGGDGDYDPFADTDYDFDIGGNNLSMTCAEKLAYLDFKDTYPELEESFENVRTVCTDENTTEAEKTEALNNFRDLLYSKKDVREAILQYMNRDKQQDSPDNPEADVINPNYNNWGNIENEFQYYVGLWEIINKTGGCEVIEDEYMSGSDGTTWLNNMVNAGIITIASSNRDNNKGFVETSVISGTDDNYLMQADDDTDVKKAEAEYQHELSIINKKDARIDKELKDLELKRNSKTEQMESLKTVIGDNVDKTFNIFS